MEPNINISQEINEIDQIIQNDSQINMHMQTNNINNSKEILFFIFRLANLNGEVISSRLRKRKEKISEYLSSKRRHYKDIDSLETQSKYKIYLNKLNLPDEFMTSVHKYYSNVIII